MPTPLKNQVREIIHGVSLGRLNIMIRIAEDALVIHPDSTTCTLSVLFAAKPDWITHGGEKYALVDVERPTIVTGQPGHV